MSKLYTYNNKTQSMRAWAIELGFKSGTLSNRLRNGWDFKKAIETPINTTRKKYSPLRRLAEEERQHRYG